jgi:hypothetical protein
MGDGQFVVLSATSEGLTVGFQRVPEEKAGKNWLHLDLIVEDLDVATSEIETRGGRWLEPSSVCRVSEAASRSAGESPIRASRISAASAADCSETGPCTAAVMTAPLRRGD